MAVLVDMSAGLGTVACSLDTANKQVAARQSRCSDLGLEHLLEFLFASFKLVITCSHFEIYFINVFRNFCFSDR